MTWETLINGEAKKPFEKKLTEIADILVTITEKDLAGEYTALSQDDIAAVPESTATATEGEEEKEKPKAAQKNIGVMGGSIGLALFMFYYAKYTDEDRYAQMGVDLISNIFEEINKGFSYHTLAGGLAGIGWSIELLAKQNFIDADTDEVLEQLDPYLHKTMIYDIQNENFDFLHGAVGNGVYFLSRRPNPKADEYLKELIDELDKVGHADEDGSRKWVSVLDHESGKRGYNLSMSHGIASIITFLGKVMEIGIYNEKTMRVLEGAVKYLLKYRLDRSKFLSHFPSWISENDPLTQSRLAWCYGDLGISMALWQAGQGAHRQEWQDIAKAVLLDSTARRDIRDNAVQDVGLCHGAAGIAHVYNRAYQFIKDPLLKDTTLYWAQHILNMAVHEDGFAGYKAWRTPQYGGWTPEPGFLEGIAGIGLALISLMSDIEPTWDRCLFLS